MTALFPHTSRAWARLKAAVADCWGLWLLSRYLGRRTEKRVDCAIIRRKTDGTLWAAGSPQNFAYAMRGLFTKHKLSFHFYRVREWQGLLVASRRVFWLPESGDFDLLYSSTLFILPPWPEAVECAKLDEIAA